METCRHLDYRSVMKDAFSQRLGKNPRYSMRAFARDLVMTPQMLSAVFAGKKDLSIDSAAEITARLGLDPQQAQNFLDLILLSGCKSDAAKSLVRSRLNERNRAPDAFRPLAVEMFRAIADWYHLAILELVSCQGFRSDPRWIANRLGISVFEAREAGLSLV